MVLATIDSNEARLQWRGILDNAEKGDVSSLAYGKPVAVVIPYDAWLGIQGELEDGCASCTACRRPSRRRRDHDGAAMV